MTRKNWENKYFKFQKEDIFRKNEDSNRKEMFFFCKESEDKKEFKIRLGGNDTEKVYIPSYGDNDLDETLLNLVKDFNLLIENR